ncbi:MULTISPECIES: type III secretion system cytoplasmic ring protein SctQ [unclassified Bradyrhizobium]|uniref:type III secretion system cytoplasmic ring protein SctQ n=1 Tax=unclassified Bradyrhizobium TaxID=2631580 RepID=UPI0028E2A59A|nr:MULTISPECIES: type III secretion system cytoplasmic ring protein SctQ [unclassified Bradyrhizobium]
MNAPFPARGRGAPDGEITEFHPDVLSIADVLRARRWCRRLAELTCELAGLPLRISFSGASSGVSSRPACRLHFTIGGDPCAVSLPVEVIDATLQAIDGPPRTTLAEPDLLLLIEFACAAILDAIEETLGLPVILTHASFDGSVPDSIGIPCRGRFGERSFSAYLSLAEPYESRLANQVQALGPAAAAGVPICAAFRLGATRVSARLLASLRPGDVVIIEHAMPGGRVAAVFGERRLTSCRFEGGDATVVDTLHQIRGDLHHHWTAVDMTAHESVDTGADDVSLDDLQIKLLFEIGQLEIPLGELRMIAPGYVFNLGRDPRHAIEIHAGNRRIGQGEIVRIGEAIGVRINRLFNHE